MPSTTDLAHDLAGRIEAAFNGGSAAAWANCFAEDAVQIHPFFPAPNVGRAAILAAESVMFTAFDQIKLEVTNVVAGGEWTVFEMRVTARHCAPIAMPDGSEIPVTGKVVDLTMASVVRIGDDGLILEEHRYEDNLSFLRQLGLV
jgi:ketosteroid isomerase-like protein